MGDSITYLNDHLEETGKRVTKGYLTIESAIRMTYDGLHPSEDGNEVIAEEINTLFKTFVF